MALQDLHRSPLVIARFSKETALRLFCASRIVAIHRIHKCSARNMLESTFTLKY